MLAMGQFAMSRDVAGLTDDFARLVGDVNSLRETLAKLEATQEEVEAQPAPKLAKAGDDDDADDKTDDDTDDDADDDTAAAEPGAET